jgi:hypothetical protein
MNRIACTLTAALFAIAALAGCAGVAGNPSRAKAYVTTSVCGIDLDGKASEARLRIDLIVIRPLPPNGLVEAQFENPSDAKSPLVTSRTVTGKEKALRLISPPVTGIRVKAYEVVVRIYSSQDKRELLGTHAQSCQSPVDLRDLGPQFR